MKQNKTTKNPPILKDEFQYCLEKNQSRVFQELGLGVEAEKSVFVLKEHASPFPFHGLGKETKQLNFHFLSINKILHFPHCSTLNS